MFIFSQPWGDIVVLPFIGAFSRILGILLLPLALIGLIDRGSVRISFTQFIVLAFASWVTLSLFWTLDTGRTQTAIITYVQLVSFYLIFTNLIDNESRLRSILLAFLAGEFILLSNLAYRYVTQYDELVSSTPWEVRFSAGNFDPNEMSAMLIVGIPLAWYLLNVSREKWVRVMCTLYIPLCIGGVLLSGSRGGLITLVLIILLMGLVTIRSKRSFFYVGIAGLFIGFSGIWFAGNFLPESTISRLINTGTDLASSETDDRSIVWEEGLHIISEYPISGVGAGCFMCATRHTTVLVAHNVFISLAVDLGIIGLFIFLLLIALPLLNFFHWPDIWRRFVLLFLTAWFVPSLSLSIEYSRLTWFVLGVIDIISYVGLQKDIDRTP